MLFILMKNTKCLVDQMSGQRQSDTDKFDNLKKLFMRPNNSHCLETKLKHKRMNNLQFYIPGFQNHPSYPKQKEF